MPSVGGIGVRPISRAPSAWRSIVTSSPSSSICAMARPLAASGPRTLARIVSRGAYLNLYVPPVFICTVTSLSRAIAGNAACAFASAAASAPYSTAAAYSLSVRSFASAISRPSVPSRDTPGRAPVRSPSRPCRDPCIGYRRHPSDEPALVQDRHQFLWRPILGPRRVPLFIRLPVEGHRCATIEARPDDAQRERALRPLEVGALGLDVVMLTVLFRLFDGVHDASTSARAMIAASSASTRICSSR